MGIKQTLEKNPAVVAGVTLVLVAIAGYMLFKSDSVEPQGITSGSRYFWDVSKNELFVGPDVVPPTPRDPKDKNGAKVGVWAHVFSCGDCKDANSRKTMFLRTWPDAAAEELKKMGRSGTMIYEVATPELIAKAQVRRPTESDWVEENSDSGRAVMSLDSLKCPSGEQPGECSP